MAEGFLKKVIFLKPEKSKNQKVEIAKALREKIDGFVEIEHGSFCNFSQSLCGLCAISSFTLKKALDKKVTPHLIRHSSATFDAGFMSHSQLCIKYGWSFSSNMPDVYIKRACVERKAIVEKFKSEKFEDIKKQSDFLKEQLKSLKNRHSQ